MVVARTELALEMLSDRMLVAWAEACARVVALNGLTRHGSHLRWLKPTRVSWATVHILTRISLVCSVETRILCREFSHSVFTFVPVGLTKARRADSGSQSKNAGTPP